MGRLTHLGPKKASQITNQQTNQPVRNILLNNLQISSNSDRLKMIMTGTRHMQLVIENGLLGLRWQASRPKIVVFLKMLAGRLA